MGECIQEFSVIFCQVFFNYFNKSKMIASKTLPHVITKKNYIKKYFHGDYVTP